MAYGAVETFDMSVLSGLAGLDTVQSDLSSRCPALRGAADAFRPIGRGDYLSPCRLKAYLNESRAE